MNSIRTGETYACTFFLQFPPLLHVLDREIPRVLSRKLQTARHGWVQAK
jgi:hypothetical protein